LDGVKRMIRFIRNPRFHWKEPRAAVAVRNRLFRESIPISRRFLAASIQAGGIGLLGLVLAWVRGDPLSGLLVGAIVALIALATMKLVGAQRWKAYILDDCVAIQTGSGYRYLTYRSIESASTRRLDHRGSQIAFLDLELESRGHVAVGLDPGVPEPALLDFIRSRVA